MALAYAFSSVTKRMTESLLALKIASTAFSPKGMISAEKRRVVNAKSRMSPLTFMNKYYQRYSIFYLIK